MARFSFVPKAGVYETVDVATRMRLIGSCLTASGGDKWLDTHPAQVRWMADNGIKPAECADAFEKWYASQIKVVETLQPAPV